MKRRSVGRAPAKPASRRPGRPQIHETWTKVSVVLFERQVHDLDHLADSIRRQGHRSINRASLIRALIDGIMQSRLDLSGHSSEATLRDDISRRMNKGTRSL